jgi:hypothetical protein
MEEKKPKNPGRREFIRQGAAAAAVMAGAPLMAAAHTGVFGEHNPVEPLPWYRRLTRWGQTNITEKDPATYDIAWWRSYWKRTQTQGVVINAGGIVAYYPSKVPLHRQAEFLGGRDLFGELTRAAHDDGLAVFARMDSNRAHEAFYRAHPEWFAVDATGAPYRAGEMYITCINSPYYDEHIPAILREVATLYRPEGFTDNSWSGLGRGSVCHCRYCRERFKAYSGHEIPAVKNWDDPAYRAWIQWNYRRRLEIWDLFNETTRSAGGADCIWVGMNHGTLSGQSAGFRDYREISRRAGMIMLDYQARSIANGLQHNAETGLLIHDLLGWDKLIPESMAMYYHNGWNPVYRVSSQTEPEARLWAASGFAGGIQPWWHHVGAYHEDRRTYNISGPIYRWHRQNEEYLIRRQPLATVGVLWSQENLDFYGRDEAEWLVELPWRGMTQALRRARIPFRPLHLENIQRDAAQFSALVLPNVGLITDRQAEALRRFVQQGGGLLATGQSSLFGPGGDPRPDYALADLYGAHVAGNAMRHAEAIDPERGIRHTYLRLKPELRGTVEGPLSGQEPVPAGKRHEVLEGFDETDILAFGGLLQPFRVDAGVQSPMTFIPEFPIYPPETAWMRQPDSGIPGLLLNTLSGGGKVAFLPADLDRQFGQYQMPDHGHLLANLVRWVAGDGIPLKVEGAGFMDCHLYRQDNRLILHLVNLSGEGAWRSPVHEILPVGPLEVSVRLPSGLRPVRVELRVAERDQAFELEAGWCRFTVDRLHDHELVVISG